MSDDLTFSLNEVVQDQLTEVAKAAVAHLGDLGFVVLAMHGDGFVQYTTSVDPLFAGAIMLDLGNAIVRPNAKPDWYEFQNRLRVMRSIYRHDMVENGLIEANDLSGWKRFEDDPFTWMMKADDDKASRLWKYIEQRVSGK